MVTPNIANIKLFARWLDDDDVVQNKLHDATEKYIKHGGTAINVDEDMMIDDVTRIKENIEIALLSVFNSEFDLSTEYDGAKAHKTLGTLNYTFYIKALREQLWRDSLNVDKYGGVYDIIGLFTHGYDTGGKCVYGTWHGEEIRSLPRRAGDAFMHDIIHQANVDLEDEYRSKGVRAVAISIYDDVE